MVITQGSKQGQAARYRSQKAEWSLCQRGPGGEHGLAEGDDQEKSTPLDHVVGVKGDVPTMQDPTRHGVGEPRADEVDRCGR